MSDNDSETSAVTVSEAPGNDQVQAATQHQRVGSESALESFPSGSSGQHYVANQQNLVEDMTRQIQPNQQNFTFDLRALIREQSAEIGYLKLENLDLSSSNADLRTQLHEERETCEDKTEKLIEANRKNQALMGENSDLRREIRLREKTIKKLSESISSLQQENENLQRKITENQAT